MKQLSGVQHFKIFHVSALNPQGRKLRRNGIIKLKKKVKLQHHDQGHQLIILASHTRASDHCILSAADLQMFCMESFADRLCPL